MQSVNITISRLAYTVGLALTVVAVSASAAAAAGAQGETFIPGVTDFPSRVDVTAERNEFVPGATDFPSRLGETGEAAAEARLAGSHQSSPVTLQIAENGFDWSAAATGAIAATLLLLGAGLAVRTARRSRVALG